MASEPIKPVKNCFPNFSYVCSKTWEELTPGSEPNVRHCSECDHDVFLVTTRKEYLQRKGQRACIAGTFKLDLVDRRLLGVIGADYFRPRKQVVVMRERYRRFNGDEERAIAEYALEERRGFVRRKSNVSGMTAEKYARALLKDGLRKGWLRRDKSHRWDGGKIAGGGSN